MIQKETPYPGAALLSDLEVAVNYNSHVASLMAPYFLRTDFAKPEILDFGAGYGTLARFFKKQNISVCCIEPDASLRKDLKKSGFEVFSCFKDSTKKWDFIYSANVLEHIQDDRKAVAEIADALKKNGIAILYVPAFMALYTSFDKKIGHHRRYTVESLSMLFTGFEILRAEYVDSLGFFAALVFKLFDAGSGEVSKKTIQNYDTYVFPISKKLDICTRPFFGKNVLLVAKKL